jgi:hypothetical protein
VAQPATLRRRRGRFFVCCGGGREEESLLGSTDEMKGQHRHEEFYVLGDGKEMTFR